MKKFFIIALACVLGLTISCKKDPKDTPASKLTVVTDDLVTVPYAGQDGILVEFICDGKWAAAFEGENDWATIEGEVSGEGNGSLNVNVAANDSKEERIATLKITAGSLSASVVFKQEFQKLNITFKHPSIAFTDEQFAKLKKAYEELPTTSSLKAALDLVVTRGNGNYDPATVAPASVQNITDAETFYKSAKGPSVLCLNKCIAWKIHGESDETKDKYVGQAARILVYWAQNSKDVQYPTGTAGTDEENPNGGYGMYLARVMWPFFVTYDVIKDKNVLTAEEDAVVVAWFRNIEKTIKSCINFWHNNDYLNKQEWNNWLIAHMWGLVSIGYALDDASLVQFAIDSEDNPRDFYELIQGCIFMEGDTPCVREKTGKGIVETGELYDRYRHDTAPLKGLQYTALQLQELSCAARTCYNNGIDMYAYTAPTGENIRLCYDYYADYYATKDCSLHNGYYAGEDSRITLAGDMQGLFELGYNAYPESTQILKVINAIPKREENKVQMHDQLGYTRLYSVDVDPTK